MKNVHFILQGKGGIGKSVIASWLAQYYQAQNLPLACIDADPINTTLLGYKALQASHIQLMTGSQLDARRFDEMMERILSEDTHFIVDNGAASFIPLSNYLIENQAIDLIAQHHKQVVVHSIITGGQALIDTLNGFAQLVEQLPAQVVIIVWLNAFFGSIVADGKPFEQMQTYLKHRHRISGIIYVAKQSEETFGKDLACMLEKKLTFAQINAHPEFSLMAKQRLAMVKKVLFDQLHFLNLG